MDVEEYKKKWKQNNSVIISATAEIFNNWSPTSGEYTVSIKHATGGSNGIARFAYQTATEKTIAFGLAKKYAQRIQAAKAGML